MWCAIFLSPWSYYRHRLTGDGSATSDARNVYTLPRKLLTFPGSRLLKRAAEKRTVGGSSVRWWSFLWMAIFLSPLYPRVLSFSDDHEETNPRAKGWVSTDRSVVTALPSTTPRQVRKSSTDDSEHRHRSIELTHDRPFGMRPADVAAVSAVRRNIVIPHGEPPPHYCGRRMGLVRRSPQRTDRLIRSISRRQFGASRLNGAPKVIVARYTSV